ncbi:MAG: hypothetical protein NWE83_04665 [Candidatus Bathyarchaeota archaeon]|nr:hypothetical protein [Candidatus Bathyarchaeota archaeon]
MAEQPLALDRAPVGNGRFSTRSERLEDQRITTMTSTSLGPVALSVLEYCKQPRRLHDVIYGELATRLEARRLILPFLYSAWWQYLADIIHDLERRGLLARDQNRRYYTITETSRYYR